MNQLIKISENKTVSARELHEWLEVKNHFTQWFDDNKGQFEQNSDYKAIKVFLNHSNGIGGVNQTDYEITIDMAKELSMLSKVEKGKQARKYFIEVEKRALVPMSDEEMTLMVVSRLQTKVLELKNKNDELEKKEEYHAPMVETYHLLVDSGKALDFEKAAKNMGIKSRTQLIRILTSFGYINKSKLPTPNMIEKGYMIVKQVVIPNMNEPYTQTFITMKGVEYLAKKINLNTDSMTNNLYQKNL